MGFWDKHGFWRIYTEWDILNGLDSLIIYLLQDGHLLNLRNEKLMIRFS